MLEEVSGLTGGGRELRGFRESLQGLDVHKPSWRAAGGTEQQRMQARRLGFSCRVETSYRYRTVEVVEARYKGMHR